MQPNMPLIDRASNMYIPRTSSINRHMQPVQPELAYLFFSFHFLINPTWSLTWKKLTQNPSTYVGESSNSRKEIALLSECYYVTTRVKMSKKKSFWRAYMKIHILQENISKSKWIKRCQSSSIPKSISEPGFGTRTSKPADFVSEPRGENIGEFIVGWSAKVPPREKTSSWRWKTKTWTIITNESKKQKQHKEKVQV